MGDWNLSVEGIWKRATDLDLKNKFTALVKKSREKNSASPYDTIIPE